MDESSENVTLYGTPLEDLLEDELPSNKSEQDLTVRDEQGRRRFHGAFTGGFSAGYYNTVDTKEGWTPSTFQSSRKRKAEAAVQRPEDYMDNEDLNEFGIAPRRVQATKDFRDDTSKHQSQINELFGLKSKHTAIPGPSALLQIVKPTSHHIGVRLLMSMGWKPGQGIGPRVRKEAAPEGKRVYGCQLPTETDFSDDIDENLTLFTFAPQDTADLPFVPKDNLNGIGYSGMKSTSLLEDKYDYANPTTTKAVFKTGKKIAIRGQAFGVGALEDDDDDIYAKDDMTQYDFQLSDPKDKLDSISRNKKGQLRIKDGSIHDHLEGFSPASKPRSNKKVYPPPKIPENFRPNRLIEIPKSIQEAILKHSPQSNDTAANKGSKFLNRHFLTVEERAQLIGDKFRTPSVPLPATLQPVSVPEIQPCSQQTVNSKMLDGLEFASTQNDQKFQPFAVNPEKQRRYQIFLNMQKEGRTDFPSMQPSSMTDWEKEKEREEFYRASVLFRPLSQGLSNRFVSTGATLDEAATVLRTKDEASSPSSEETKGDKPLERILLEWHPDKLLCRRFNIPNPFPDSSASGTRDSGKKGSMSIFSFLTTADSLPKLPDQKNEKPLEENIKSSLPSEIIGAENVAPSLQFNVELGQKKAETAASKNEKDGQERPTVDFFKAIFLDDSDDEDASETESKAGNVTIQNPSGVFASLPSLEKSPVMPKLDTPALNSDAVRELSAPLVEVAKDIVELPREKVELFGPALPPNYSSAVVPSLDLRERHKSSGKKKKKKDKHKKKKQKKSRRRSSSSSSTGSTSSETEITKKLKRKLIELKRM